MLTKRQVVIEKPFQDRRYQNHRRKVTSALPRIDSGPPRHFDHLDVKMKKLQIEKERQNHICENNLRLVHRMSIIMRTKRMDDINNSPKGPFHKRPKTSISISQKNERRISEPGRRISFLEKLTEEAMRSTPTPRRKMIEHRAPHGHCLVPKIGVPSMKKRVRGFKPKAPQLDLSYPESHQPVGRRCSLCGGLIPQPNSEAIESYCKCNELKTLSTRIRPKSARPMTSRLRIRPEDSCLYSDDFSETSDNCNHSSEAEGTSHSSNKSHQETNDIDNHITAVLLGQAPSITIDEASDDSDEFFGQNFN